MTVRPAVSVQREQVSLAVAATPRQASPRWRWLAGAGWLVVGIALLLIGRAWLWPHQFHGILLQSPQPAPDFVLESSAGHPMHLSDWRSKYVLLFFGYTSCPDVCPLTLVDLAKTRQLLGEQADQAQVVLVSVDPVRDTPARLAAYLAAFDPSFLGMTGRPEAVEAVATQFGVFFAQAPTGDNAFVEHTTSVTVIDPRGYVRLLFAPQTPSADMAADLQRLMR
jgi:protein SCO1/2